MVMIMVVMKTFVASPITGPRAELPNHNLWYVSIRLRIDDSQIAAAALEIVTPIVFRLDFVGVVVERRKHGRGYGLEGLQFRGSARGLATLVQHGRIGDLLGAMGEQRLTLVVPLSAASGQVQSTVVGTAGIRRWEDRVAVGGDSIALGDLCFRLW